MSESNTKSDRLDGGVASDLKIVDGPDGPLVIKNALAELRVKAPWHSNPKRSLIEASAIKTAAELIGKENVPQIVSVDTDNNSFAMRLVDERLVNWKKSLLSGNLSPATAERAGHLLAELHTRSASRSDISSQFENLTFFEELRIEPFFYRVASQFPDISGHIHAIADGMNNRRTALVHGDYSPKNILANESDLVILDFEVAHWGDPRFDVAFCTSHLLLKAARKNSDTYEFYRLLRTFLRSYRKAGPNILDEDFVRIAGCLQLARIHGASPVEYIHHLNVEDVRMSAQIMIASPKESKLSSIIDSQV